MVLPDLGSSLGCLGLATRLEQFRVQRVLCGGVQDHGFSFLWHVKKVQDDPDAAARVTF